MKTYSYLVLLTLIGLFLTGCVTTKHPPLDVTFLPERGEFISPEGARMSFHQALKLAAGADYVIMGEGHRNSCDHAMQQRMVRGLVEIGRGPALGLEMVPVSLQATLDKFNAGEIAPEDLAQALDWQKTWGYPYKLFAPLFELAAERNLPVAGLNAPKEVTKKASREGIEALTEEDRKYYPDRVIPHLAEQEDELREIFEMHGSKLGDDAQLGRFLLVQSIWDSMMAEQAVALKKRTNRPVFIIAGSGHVDHGYGIPRRVGMLDPGAKVVTLAPVRDLSWFAKDLGSASFYCPVSYESRMKMTLEVRQGRVVVAEVQPGGRAAKAGIRPGDELVKAQGRRVRGLMDLHRAGKTAHDTNKSLVLGFNRHGERVDVNLGKLSRLRSKPKAEPKAQETEPAMEKQMMEKNNE